MYGAGWGVMVLRSSGSDDSAGGLVGSIVIHSSVKRATCLSVCLSLRPYGMNRAWNEANLALGLVKRGMGVRLFPVRIVEKSGRR